MKEETCYLWISQLPPNATQQTLTELFSSYSCVLATKIHEAGNLRGAVLSFPDSKSAAKACAARHLLNGHSLISEHCDQSGEPGLQRLKDLARRDFSEKKSLENGSTSVNNNNSPPIRTQAGKQDGGGKLKVLKVWNFPDRSSDGSIQNGLLHEYRKLGKVSSVQVRGERDDRHALIVFKRAEDAESAYELTKSGKSFFGMTLNVERLEAADDAEPVLDEFHSRASRTLLVSNIEPGVRETDLRDKLAAFGTILDVELRPATEGPTQAIVQFSDIRGAAAALRHPDGVTIGSQRLRLTYHRSQPTDCVWLANLAPAVTEPLLSKTFSCHGRLRDVCVNSHRQCALVFFNEVDGARRAVEAMKCASLAGQRLLLDFASQPCQKHFVDELVTSGQCSDYKLFDQLLAPELHRGIIPSPKAAAHYRELMLEYVKATGWRKMRKCRPEDVSQGPESVRSECSDADTSGSTAEQSGTVSDSDRLSVPGWQLRKSSQSPALTTRSPASTRRPVRAAGAAAVSAGPSMSERDTRCLEQAVSAYEAAFSTSRGLFDCPSPTVGNCANSEANPTFGMAEEEVRSSSTMPTPPETPVSPTPPLTAMTGGRTGLIKRRRQSDDSDDVGTASGRSGGRHRQAGGIPSIKRETLTEEDKKQELHQQPDLAVFDPAWIQPYESMYDKIKRRQASRTVSASDGVRLARSGDSRRQDDGSRKRPRPRPSVSRQQSGAGASASDSDDEATIAEEADISPNQAPLRPKKPHQQGGSSSRFRGRKSTTTATAGSDGGNEKRRRGSSAAGKAPASKRQHRSSKPGKAGRGKMSVDSVFGSSSDSEEAAAPSTPSTIAMTDSSRAESVVDPGSPAPGSRLTDIFAEAKAQLDPRAVTEKSLFVFSDDETFEPAPDLPTIDRFQPDVAAPSPQDRAEDAEPPKLAAAHADLETTAAHALAQLSQRTTTAGISLSQPHFRVPELTLRPLIPAPPPPPPLPPTQSQPQPLLQPSASQPQPTRPPAVEPSLMLHPVGPSAQNARPPMQPAAQQDLEQFVQDVIRKVQAAPPNQPACWEPRQQQQQSASDVSAVSSASVAAAIVSTAAPNISVASDAAPVQPTISLTGGLAQRPVKKSQPAMEALALQHVDDIIRDVVEGHIDLAPYMERGRLRHPSCDRFAPTPVPPAATPVRPPSVSLPTSTAHSSLSVSAATCAPELRIQPFSICPVSAGPVSDASAVSMQQSVAQQLMPPQSIAVAALPVSSTTTESTGNATYAQRMQQHQQQQQQQTQQQQAQLQALYMQLLASGRYPQDLLYSPYVSVPQLQLFQPASAPPPLPSAPPTPAVVSQPQQQPPPQPTLPMLPTPQQQQQQPPPPQPTLAPPTQLAPPPSQQPQPPQQLQPPTQVQPQQHQSQPAAQSGQLDALLRKYPVKWQGRLALKNDEAGVQMHFVRGSDTLAKAALELAAPDAARVLKVAQRMRLEPAQLDGVQRKMFDEAEYCVLLAVACGVNAQDYRSQTHNLREAFIKYLQEKQAAGIVNVNYPGQDVPAYVVHIFPPGQFATAKLQQYASDLYANLFPQPSSETPHLLVVVTTV